MQVRFFHESDGKCFAKMIGGCAIYGEECGNKCGTYLCKWYKPQGCKDWVRLDDRYTVRLYPPEELEKRHADKQQTKGSEI